MKKIALIIFDCFIVFFSCIGYGQNVDHFDVVRNALEISGVPKRQVSFYVQNVRADKPIVLENAMTTQNPASLMKLVISYVALKSFGANYQWKTNLLSEGIPNAHGELNKPLYLKGSGDPKLVVEKVAELFNGLKQSGVSLLNAPLFIDRSIFKVNEQSDYFDDSLSSPYNARADAALMNYHAVNISLDPFLKRMSINPSLINYQWVNFIDWVKGACPDNGWKSNLSLSSDVNSIVISGRYYSSCSSQQLGFYPHQLSGNAYAYGLIAGLLSDACVDACVQNLIWHPEKLFASEMVKDGLVPKMAKILSSVESEPLSQIIKDMNHFSNNVMAKQIYLSLSAQEKGVGSLVASEAVVNRVLLENDIKTIGLKIDNGSGLSRVARIRAIDLGTILVNAANNVSLYDSLPVIGVSGTIKNRLKNTNMVGRGRIKTGTLNDVRSIAGYIDGKSGARYAVVSIIEGEYAQTAQARLLHDVFMQWVGEQ